MSGAKAYLGDGVYADVDDLRQIVLTAENGIEVTNTIALEPEVLDALNLYAKRVWQRRV